MKLKLLPALILTLALPLAAQADVNSDMANSQLSLVQVMQNAKTSNMSTAATVAAMIKADASQSSAIIATAMIVAPEDYEAIIAAAIEAGAKADQVVAAALIASDGENADKIIAAAVAAAPQERQAIAAAATRALPQTAGMAGMTASAATPMSATSARAAGGGAAVTASDVTSLTNTIASIEASLTAAGFTAAETATAVSNLTTALEQSQATVAQTKSNLETLQSDLVAAQAAQARLVELEVELALAEERATEVESEVDASIAAATSVVSTTKKAAASLAASEAELAALESTNAQVKVDKAEFDALASDPAAAKTLATTKKTAAQTQLATLGSEEETSANVATAESTLNTKAEQDASVDLDIQKVQSAISALESVGVAQIEIEGAIVTVRGKDLAALEQSLNQLIAEKAAINLPGAQAQVSALRATLKQITRLKKVVAVYEAVENELAVNPNQTSFQQAQTLFDGLVAEGDEEATQAALNISVQRAFVGEQTSKQQEEINKLNAQIAQLTETVKVLKTTQTEKQAAETAADLGKIADKIDDAIASASQA